MDETVITLTDSAHSSAAMSPMIPECADPGATDMQPAALPYAPMAMPVQNLSPAPFALLPPLRMAWPRLTVRF